jgi:fructose-1,6-bisphosphatase II
VDRNLALEFVRVTEGAAIAAARWMGRGEPKAADQAAVDAMHRMFSIIEIDGEVVIGEGEKDEAPRLYVGERLGTGKGPQVDIAVDPLEGTDIVARGTTNAIAVIACAPRGTLLSLPDMYMWKIAVGPEAKGMVDLDATPAQNVRLVAKALGKPVGEVTVVVLDRPRHEDLIKEIRGVGARIQLIPDGDVSAAVATAFPESGVDMLLNIGGATEGVLAAAALKCVGGEIFGRLHPTKPEHAQRMADFGIADPRRIYAIDDMVRTENVVFAATGVTEGDLLEGVRFTKDGARTNSIVMRSLSGTSRRIHARHRWRRAKGEEA